MDDHEKQKQMEQAYTMLDILQEAFAQVFNGFMHCGDKESARKYDYLLESIRENRDCVQDWMDSIITEINHERESTESLLDALKGLR